MGCLTLDAENKKGMHAATATEKRTLRTDTGGCGVIRPTPGF